MSVAVAARLFFNVFFGEKPARLTVQLPGWSIQIPPLLLAVAALIFGVFPGALDGMVNWLSVSGLHMGPQKPLMLWHGFTAELFSSLLIFAAGAALYVRLQKIGWWKETPRWLRFDAAFERGLEGLTRFSKKLTHALRADWPPAYLPILIFFLLAVLVAAIAASPLWFVRKLTSIHWYFVPLRAVTATMIIAALGVMLILRRWTAQLIALSVAGFFQTLYFALYKAPDLAMTQILVESATIVMMLFLLSHFPGAQRAVRSDRKDRKRRLVHIGLPIGAGVAMGGLVLFAELHRHPDPIGPRLLELSEPVAEGTNAVNTILVDFRGFDTLGEITVVLIATVGALGLMMRYKRGRSEHDSASPPGFFLGGKGTP
jgi:multisubunit Na+/H+ antiporter MnhB subunit